MRFGVQYNGVSMGSVVGPVEFAEKAERWGYDAYFVPDLETFAALEPMTLLSAVSQRTSRLELGTGVLALPLRSPYQLAKSAVSVDTLSGGRLNLGVGTGIFPLDFQVERVDIRRRGRITDEYLGALRSLLDGTTVSYHGERTELDGIALAPSPTRRIPIWLGSTWTEAGFSRAALERAARFCDTFHPHEVPATGYADAIRRIRELAGGFGRDPSAISYGCNMWLCMGDSKASAMEEVREAMRLRYGGEAWDIDPNSCIAIGTPADIIETIESYTSVGVSAFIMNTLSTPDNVLPYVEDFAKSVVRHFRANAT